MPNLQLVKGNLVSWDSIRETLESMLPDKIIGNPIDTLRYKPQPKQDRLLEVCGLKQWYYMGAELLPPICNIIGYGGAAFGAKTYGVLGLAAIIAYAFPGAQISFFRRTYTEIEGAGGAMQLAYRVFNGLAEARDSGRNFVFPNGSNFFFQHCENENDVHRYEGKAFDVLLIDEATHFTWYALSGVGIESVALQNGEIGTATLGPISGGGASTSTLARNAIPLRGVLKLCLVDPSCSGGEMNIALTAPTGSGPGVVGVGVGGTVSGTAQTFTGTTPQVNYLFYAAPWTLKTVTVWDQTGATTSSVSSFATPLYTTLTDQGFAHGPDRMDDCDGYTCRSVSLSS